MGLGAGAAAGAVGYGAYDGWNQPNRDSGYTSGDQSNPGGNVLGAEQQEYVQQQGQADGGGHSSPQHEGSGRDHADDGPTSSHSHSNSATGSAPAPVPVDQRLDPRTMLNLMHHDNHSESSLRDEEDYSRKILKVSNPDNTL